MMMKGKEMSNRHADAIDYILDAANNEQLETLAKAIRMRRETLARKNRFALRVGNAVKFEHRGMVYSGTVTAIKLKKASVACTSPTATTYNVPLNMLQAA
jgi:hypothetical protein